MDYSMTEKKLCEKYSLSDAEAQRVMKKYW